MAKKTSSAYLLPVDRMSFFRFALKNNWRLLASLSLLLSLFLVPLLAELIAHFIYEASLLGATASDSAAQWTALQGYRRYAVFALIPASMIAAWGFGGFVHVLRRFVYNEGYAIWDDFKIGLKRNAKRFIALGAFFSLLFSLVVFGLSFFDVASGISYYLFFFGLEAVFLLVSLPLMIESFFLSEVYQNTFGQCLLESGFLAFRYPGYSLGIIGLFLPVLFLVLSDGLLGFWGSILTLVIVFLLGLASGFGLVGLVLFLFINHVFDEGINRKQFPDYYRKGLFAKEKKP